VALPELAASYTLGLQHITLPYLQPTPASSDESSSFSSCMGNVLSDGTSSLGATGPDDFVSDTTAKLKTMHTRQCTLSTASSAAQDLTIEDLAAAGIYALTRHGLGEGLPSLDESRFSPPDPRDISECEGLLEVRRRVSESQGLTVAVPSQMTCSYVVVQSHGERMSADGTERGCRCAHPAASNQPFSPGPQVYFKQADDLLRRLVTTRSRIADTEASIEVLLDQRRNGLVA
jgi:hypothetical protein